MSALPPTGESSDDARWMALALEQATRARPHCHPNPAVGCVLVTPSGVSITGFTQAPGKAHAEAYAIEQARARGIDICGATAYVTLEPCSHHGRTPPCADALVGAGIRRVVAAVEDPNPLVAGQGLARLRAAGVEVEAGLMAEQARELNLGFFSRMVRGLPWVRVKIAASLDGHTALDDGQSQWITSAEARADGHAWRARAGAVLTGKGTVLADDPQLNVRGIEGGRQPLRVIVDSTLVTPPSARILQAEGRTLVYAAHDDAARRAALERAGAEVVLMPGSDGRVALRSVACDLAKREINELHVEAGATLNGALMRESLVDELLIYLAPKLLGRGRKMIDLDAVASLELAPALRIVEAAAIGPDLRVLARLPERDRF